jgi:hypothetical protein
VPVQVDAASRLDHVQGLRGVVVVIIVARTAVRTTTEGDAGRRPARLAARRTAVTAQ